MRKTVTVVFCDLVGSTALGERLDPETTRQIMDRYFTAMKTVLERHGGVVEKFIGDAVMAVFGLPQVHEDDPVRAVRAASDMTTAVIELNDELERRWGVTLATRTGISTGVVVVGDPASGQRLATGDAINVAARLEQAAAPGEILVGDTTYRLVKDAVTVEAIPPLPLKGKSEPVPAYRLIEVHRGREGVARRFDTPLVGRDKEMARIEHAFERAVERASCELDTVVGEAGVGKSRLVREVVADLRDRAEILQGRCLPYGEAMTLWPLAEAIRQAAGIADDDPVDAARGKLSSRFSGSVPDVVRERLAAVVGLSATAFPIEESFWAVRKAFAALAGKRPLVVVFEDLHWGDLAFLDFVAGLPESTREAPLFVLCTARRELLEEHPEWSQERERVEVIDLDPLSASESEGLITNLLGAAKLDAAAIAAINNSARGNPLFVEQIIAMWIEDKTLQTRNGEWVWSQTPSAIAIPSTLGGLLSSRLDRLSQEERAVIGAAAVVGEIFYVGAVRELCAGQDRAHVEGCLGSLIRKDLLRPEDSTFAEEEAFAFRHILIRDAAYEAVLKSTRAALHERLASWLEDKADGAVELEEIIGFHLEHAYLLRAELGRVDEEARALALEAARRLASAGRSAFARTDNRAAAGLLGRARRLFAEAPGGLELLPELAEALWQTGDAAAAEAALKEAISCDNERVKARAVVGRALMFSTSSEESLDEVEATISLFRQLEDEAGVATAWRVAGILSWWLGRLSAADKAWWRSLEQAQRIGDRREASFSLFMLVVNTVVGPTPVDRALERLHVLREMASGDLMVEAAVVRRLAQLRAMQGRFEEARRDDARGRSLLEDLGFERLAAAGSQAGYVEMLAGDPIRAAEEFRLDYETLEKMGDKRFVPTIAASLAHALWALNRLEEAKRYTEIAEEGATDDDVTTQILWRCARGKALAMEGEFEQAEKLARAAVDIASRTELVIDHGDALMDLGEILRLSGKGFEAAQVVEEALHMFEAKGNIVMVAKARRVLRELAA
jgi:class 3 adenylate cyclase/tetratricopeptide (TPR) repeat protein